MDANYAVSYKKTALIDLQGNVKITTSDGGLLETEQLYYDQKNEWFFTEKKFKFTDPYKGETKGDGLDFSKDFKRINFQKVSGVINEAE